MEGAHAEGGGGVEELFTLHVTQLHYFAAGVDEPQRGRGTSGDQRPARASLVLRYADQRDTTTDAEIRTWRRRKITGRSNS